MATITLGSNTYTLIALPTFPGFSGYSVSMMDAVSVVSSPYVPSQVQTQAWPGADSWSAQLQLPKMLECHAGAWRGFLASLRGMTNVFQLGDTMRTKPYGSPAGAPVAWGSNAQNVTTLNTRGWKVSTYRLLKAGDYLQVGYRMYMAAADVNSDSSGDAAISVFPSLRDAVADGTAITLEDCKGVFRLASNLRKWQVSVDQLTEISLACVEVR